MLKATKFILFLLTASITLTASEPSFCDVLTHRYSGYQFDTSRTVSLEQVMKIAEAARMSPSSYNEQPWNFIVCDKNTNKAAYEKALSTLVEFNQNWAKSAQVLIIAVAGSVSSHKGKENAWAQYDTGAASFAMALQADSMGLMAHQMGGFDAEKVTQAFSIPKGYTPMAVIAIGYPSPNEERKEKQRKALSENFFNGNFGTSF